MILSASGGLVYHARAAFTRIESLVSTSGGDRWAPTRRCVSNAVRLWLEEAQPERLVLFGPSAGYLLERDVFSKLAAPTKIIAVDPDPLARILFQRRFRSSRMRWHARRDLLPFSSATPAAFGDFLGEVAVGDPSKTAVLFLGLLGQLALHPEHATRSTHEARRILLFELRNYHWASLHDLESTTLSNRLRELPPQLRPKTRNDSPILLGRCEDQKARIELLSARLSDARTDAGIWTDHETAWIGPPQVQIPWLISPRRFHNLGFSTSRPLSSPARV